MLEVAEGADAALTIHRENAERDPTAVASMYELGRLYIDHRGDIESSRRVFTRILVVLDTLNTTGVIDLPPHWKTGMEFRGTLHHYLGVLASGESDSALAMSHFRQAFDVDPTGAYYRSYGLQMMNVTSEMRADGTAVDLSLPDSVEMDVGHVVDTAATAHCRVCDVSTVDAGAFFVEIGTADFETLAHRFFRQGWWRGVSVEPVATYLARLPSRPGPTKVNAAVSDVDGMTELFTVSEADAEKLGLPSWARGVSSLSKNHKDILDNPKIIPYYKPVLVPSLTFESLARRFPPPHAPPANAPIDLLHVDTEGHDAKIVSQALDFAEKTCAYPRHIKWEYMHVPTAEQRPLLKRLAQSGYRCFFKAKDVLCTYISCVGHGGLMWRETGLLAPDS